MCRLVAARAATPFEIGELLRPLAMIARRSKEYQGDGWGCAWWVHDRWERYRSLTPIWEDDLDQFGSALVVLGHARSAFRNEGIEIANNMPFVEDRAAFVFNGELRGVRLTAAGRIGAEKLFRFIRRMGGEGGLDQIRRAVAVVERRSAYVRAMNFVLAAGPVLRVGTRFNEDTEYFTLHLKRQGSRTTVCSEPFPGESGWEPMPSGTVLEIA